MEAAGASGKPGLLMPVHPARERGRSVLQGLPLSRRKWAWAPSRDSQGSQCPQHAALCKEQSEALGTEFYTHRKVQRITSL